MHGNGKGVGTRPTEISKGHTHVRTCTRASARHEFSFHGWRDNPSLCHFSSVFLSYRLIELPGPGEIPVTYVGTSSFPAVSFFFILAGGREETESSSSPHLRCGTLFPGIWYSDHTEIRFPRPTTCTKKHTCCFGTWLSRPIIKIFGKRYLPIVRIPLRHSSVFPRSSRHVRQFRSLHLR